MLIIVFLPWEETRAPKKPTQSQWDHVQKEFGAVLDLVVREPESWSEGWRFESESLQVVTKVPLSDTPTPLNAPLVSWLGLGMFTIQAQF